MLTKHIESKCFHAENIGAIALGSGREINAVAVVALIQQSVEEDRRSVQTNIGLFVYGCDRNGTKREIRLHGVRPVTQGEGIQMRMLGCPKNGIGDLDGDSIAHVGALQRSVLGLNANGLF